jgi:hypothetical protein
MATQIKLDVLRGTLEEDNQLSALRANGLVWESVFNSVNEFYEDHIDRKSKAHHETTDYWFQKDKNKSYIYNERLIFPEPQDLNINMMPIKYLDLEKSLPENLHCYIPMIKECRRNDGGFYRLSYEDQLEKVVYLSIHESLVPPGGTQRRAGLHIERPNALVDGGTIVPRGHPEWQSLAWGMGNYHDFACDGIYMASNTPNSSKLWHVLINAPHEVTDEHGGIEHMRSYIGDGEICNPNHLYWFTDRTPHEALPNLTEAPVYRQFFRLVVGRISVWYSKHNTPNPLGIQPTAPISDGDKFASK